MPDLNPRKFATYKIPGSNPKVTARALPNQIMAMKPVTWAGTDAEWQAYWMANHDED